MSLTVYVYIYNRELSGYVVSIFVSSWKGEELNLPFLMVTTVTFKSINLKHIYL